MYRCESCGEVQAPHVEPVKVVTQVEAYTENHTGPQGQSYGYDIIEEVNLCLGCGVEHTHLPANQVKARGSILRYPLYQALLDRGVIRPDRYRLQYAPSLQSELMQAERIIIDDKSFDALSAEIRNPSPPTEKLVEMFRE